MLLRLCALFFTPLLINGSSETQFLNRTVTSDGVAYRYVVSVPADWNADRAWPIVIFLHGSEERGEDGIVQSEVGLALAVRKHPERFPAIVVIP
jgi:predicted peptidase